MKNLSVQEKRLFSKIGIGLASLLLLGLLYIGIITLVTNWDKRYIEKEQQMIEQYNHKIDSISQVNNVLNYQVYIAEKNIDSLKKLDRNIIIKYEKKINAISDASASDHAQWMDSVLIKLDSSNR